MILGCQLITAKSQLADVQFGQSEEFLIYRCIYVYFLVGEGTKHTSTAQCMMAGTDTSDMQTTPHVCVMGI